MIVGKSLLDKTINVLDVFPRYKATFVSLATNQTGFVSAYLVFPLSFSLFARCMVTMDGTVAHPRLFP